MVKYADGDILIIGSNNAGTLVKILGYRADGHNNYWFNDFSENWYSVELLNSGTQLFIREYDLRPLTQEEVDKALEDAQSRCECGAHSAGAETHSSYCCVAVFAAKLNVLLPKGKV